MRTSILVTILATTVSIYAAAIPATTTSASPSNANTVSVPEYDDDFTALMQYIAKHPELADTLDAQPTALTVRDEETLAHQLERRHVSLGLWFKCMFHLSGVVYPADSPCLHNH